MKHDNQVKIMGIINATPDSFSDGGDNFEFKNAVDSALRLIEDGADILDIGGESTKPFAEDVSVEEELRRVLPIIKKIRELNQNIKISIDTQKSEVALKALDAGANYLNDVSALSFDPNMRHVASKFEKVFLMHRQGTSKNMQVDPKYNNLILEISAYLKEQAQIAQAHGVKKENIIIDPGIGFGKTVEHNLEITKNLSEFKKLGYDILYGSSRKTFHGKILNLDNPKDRDAATIASNLKAVEQGANYLRVHNVKYMREALTIWEYLS